MKRLVLVLALLLSLASPAHASITLFGAAAAPAADNGSNAGATMTITPPGSMTSGMLVVVIVQVRFAGLGWTEIKVSTTGGQAWHELDNDTCGTTLLSCRIYATRFNGTWGANPVFDGAVSLSDTATMVVFQESDATKHFDLDVLPVFATYAAPLTPFTVTATGITTLTNGAVAIAVWMSTDANTYNTLTATWAYANPGAANQVRNAAGATQSMSVAYKVIAAAGATGNVSQNQATLGGDNGATLIMAFKTIAAPAATAPVVDVLEDFENSTNGTTLTATILTNATHGTGCTWTPQSAPGAANTISTSGQMSLSSAHAVTVTPTTYTDVVSTRGASRDHTADDTDQGTFNCAFSPNKAAMSWGFFFNSNYGPGSLCGSAVVGCDYTSMAVFADVSGAFTAFNLNASFPNPDLVARLECNANVPQLPHVTKAHTYWITFKMDTTAGKCFGAVYDPSDSWNQVGFTVYTTISTGSTINRFQVLMTGGSFEPNATGITYYDNLALDYTTATYPLLPGTAPASSCVPSLSLLGVSSCLVPADEHVHLLLRKDATHWLRISIRNTSTTLPKSP